MKKMIHIGITLCSAAIAVVFWLLAGSQFTKMQSDPEPLKPEVNLADAAGTYLSYEAAYPFASWVEEYYSGDPDRVRTTGYVIYDVSRDAFICTIIPEEKDPGFSSLLRGMELSADMRADRDMSPITVAGSLERATPEQAERAMKALEESKVLEQYIDFTDSDAYRKVYFEDDEYGRTLAGICRKLLDGNSQTEWYVLKQGSINNMGTGEIWICIVTACLNVLIFLFSLAGLLRGSKPQTAQSDVSASIMDRFLAEQRVYAADWCTFNLNRAYRLSALSVAIPLVILLAIAFLAKAADRIMSLYLPLGLLIGEIMALILWWSQKSQSKPDKILNHFQKYLAKELPDDSVRNEFIEEYVNTESKWTFCEKTKEGMLWGKVGERYWSIFLWTGRVTIVDVSQLKEVETESVSGSVNNGTVKVSYVTYVANFYYQNDMPRRKPDKCVTFNVEDKLGFFITLVRKRAGDNIAITSK
ncbi:MAG: hypothetical protein K2I96_03125 [Lachnospiraceae bacterium]|nr:hypothetical protein [Lachnospiraceae bacterium]